MATYLSPGVYVEEVSTGPKPIAGAPTNVAAIVGRTEKGPLLEPRRLTGWNDYFERFGSPIDGSYTAESAYGFFENGGTALWIVRADNSSLSSWEVRDAANNVSFPIDAHSPGAWAADMDVRVGQEAGGGKGQVYSARITRTTAFTLTGGTPISLAVDSTVGAVAGMPVTVLDSAGNTSNGTIDTVGAGTVTVAPTTAGPVSIAANSDVRIFGTVPNGATLITFAVGSGFQPGDIIRARPSTGAAQTAVVQRVENIGAGAILTLSSGITGAVSGVTFGQKVVGLPIAIATVTVSGGKSNIAPAGVTFRGADPGFANADYVRLVTGEGLEAPFSGSAGVPPNVFLFPITLSRNPDRGTIYAKVSVTPWQDTTAFTIPAGATATDVGTILEALYSFVPVGSKITLTKAAGTQNFTRNGGGAWTTQGGVAGAPGDYTRAVQIVDPADGFDARQGLLVQSPVAPEVGDYVNVGTVGLSRITEVLQEEGMAASVYKLRFAANFGVAATGAKWPLNAWQTTPFETLRFSISATNAQRGRPVVSELYTGLSLNPAHPRYFLNDSIINKRSRLIQVGALPAAISATALTSLPMSVSASVVGAAGPLTVGRFHAAFEALERETEPALLAAPDALTLGNDMLRSAVLNDMIGHCEAHRRFAVVDLPNEPDDQALLDWRLLHLDSTYAAGYAPFLSIINMQPEGVATTVDVPPSGYVMGVFARTDNDRGVWKAPANENVKAVDHLVVPYTQRRQDLLNPKGVNLLRSFRGRGMRIWGARNLTDDTEWRYVNVRRLFLFLENSIDGGTQWVVFEPNTATTWLRVRVSVENFLNQVWRAGGLAGATPEQAYRVRVGLGQTMTETDIELGLLIIEVAVAPVYPAEFVVFRISHKRLTE